MVVINVAALVGALATPAVILLVIWWFRESLSVLFRELPRRLKSFSAAGFSIELADATPDSLSNLQVSVDLRHAGTANDVNDSTLRSFYSQIEDPARIDYAVVDLGHGSEWLSSRLYILSIILRRMRGLQACVFVEMAEGTRRRFLGVCEVESLRWRLAARWPRFESALAAAELSLWGHPYDDFPQPVNIPRALPGVPPVTIQQFNPNATIVNDEGRIVLMPTGWPEPAAILLRSFLDAVQRPGPPTSPDWQQLPSDPGRSEYAVWLTGAMLEEVLRESLSSTYLRLHDLQGWSEDLRIRAVIEYSGNWVPIVREEASFDRLINRRELLEQIGRGIVSRS